MFTGLIESLGEFITLQRQGKSATLQLKTSLPEQEIAIGDSIAVNGACLTVEAMNSGVVRFHCLAETLAKTNLGNARRGTKLNLERALLANGRLGGHIVTGHVDFTSPVISAGLNGDDFELVIALPKGQENFIVQKGSIAVNGVSLTVASVSETDFRICLIPLTQAKTNLQMLRSGDIVNIETDILGKYVAQMLHPKSNSSVTMECLAQAGFL